MTAAVIRTRQAAHAYQAYCPQCQDGMNGNKILCTRWAATHNSEVHRIAPPPDVVNYRSRGA